MHNYLFALREIVQRLIAEWYFVNTKLFPQQQCVPHSFYFFQSRQLLELPLVIKYETVSAWPPSVQVLLASDVRGTRVQNATLTSLNSYK